MLVRFWCKFGATLYVSVLTIFTISNGTLKTQRDNYLSYIQKALICRAFCFIWTVEDVGPYEVSLCWIREGRPLPYGRRILYIVGEAFRLPFSKGGSICKNSAVLFTFWEFYGIIIWGSYLLDKLEFDERRLLICRKISSTEISKNNM